MPEIYWVIGSHSDVGKTSFATALLQVLNDQGRSASGFKPFGAFSFRANFDHLSKFRADGSDPFYGMDTLYLWQASPLLKEEPIDLIGPSRWAFYGHPNNVMFMRTGCRKLNNIQYYKTILTDRILNRPDLAELFKNLGVFQNIIDADPLPLNYKSPFTKIIPSYEYLEKLDMGVLVVEGAGDRLPTWPRCPKPDKIFLVTLDEIHVFSDVNIDDKILSVGQRFALRDIGEPLRTNPRHHSMLNIFSSKDKVDESLRDIADKLLRAG